PALLRRPDVDGAGQRPHRHPPGRAGPPEVLRAPGRRGQPSWRQGQHHGHCGAVRGGLTGSRPGLDLIARDPFGTHNNPRGITAPPIKTTNADLPGTASCFGATETPGRSPRLIGPANEGSFSYPRSFPERTTMSRFSHRTRALFLGVL